MSQGDLESSKMYLEQAMSLAQENGLFYALFKVMLSYAEYLEESLPKAATENDKSEIALDIVRVHKEAQEIAQKLNLENLKEDFLKRVDILSGQVEDVAALGPEIVSQYRERLEATVKEALAGAEIDEARIIQEVAIYSDRVNFTEEIVRLQSHFEQFRSILEHAEEPVGRKLDFLIQEMNREVNTTASKANNVRAARLAVDMKSEIEKLREQVQNIE